MMPYTDAFFSFFSLYSSCIYIAHALHHKLLIWKLGKNLYEKVMMKRKCKKS